MNSPMSKIYNILSMYQFWNHKIYKPKRSLKKLTPSNENAAMLELFSLGIEVTFQELDANGKAKESHLIWDGCLSYCPNFGTYPLISLKWLSPKEEDDFENSEPPSSSCSYCSWSCNPLFSGSPHHFFSKLISTSQKFNHDDYLLYHIFITSLMLSMSLWEFSYLITNQIHASPFFFSPTNPLPR